MRTDVMRRIGWAAVVLLGAAAAARGGEADDADLKKLEGTWTAPAGDGGTVTYTFKGKSLAIEAPSRSYKMTLKLDASAKPEKTIDFQIDEAPDDAKGKTSKGIYKFDGDDKMIFCMRPMGERPTQYEMVGFEQILVELKRKK